MLSEKIVISLDTEFIENESEKVSKNDCEINAAKRLLKRLKKNYPRLPVCIQGDALYAAETVMKICEENHYLLTQIADILMQLYLGWIPLVKEIGQSIKNTSSRLLESFRRQTVTDEDVLYIQRYTTVYLE